MVSSRKRGRQEMEATEPPAERSMIERIRNMWEFANLAQWIYIFGKAVRIDENLDIEDLEMECMKSHSTVLSDIGLALLKFVSSHRGLTPDLFDEYARRQYLAKAPHRNPFGIEEESAKFIDFDAYTKIRVLQQLTQWTMMNPDRIRERMEEQKDSEQVLWRIEPFGWDSEDRTYVVLDDNRLYRQTAPPPPPVPAPTTKKNSKKARAALRASKRRKVSEPVLSDEEVTKEGITEDKGLVSEDDDGFGGMKWECLAITLDDLNGFIASIAKSRDPNEKILHQQIVNELLPLLERQEEARKRKAAQKERELFNLEKLASAKRSSRIAGKLEQQRQEGEAREIERKRQTELAMAKKEQEKWVKLEKERESRMMTREQRLKEREARRILHEEELAGLSEDSKKVEAGESRLSERHLKAEIEKKKQALEELAEEDDWVFDCICGAYGQVDDGTHSVSCEKCNIWQHTKCVGISEADANRDDFHFICKTCKRRAEEAEKARHRPTIKLKVNRPGSSSSPIPAPQLNGLVLNGLKQVSNGNQNIGFSPQKVNFIHHTSPPRTAYESPYAQPTTLPQQPHSPYSNRSNMQSTPLVKNDGKPPSQGAINPTKWSPSLNGFSSPRPQFESSLRTNGEHAFSPPQPYSPTSLPPPPQSRNYSFVNGQSSPMVPRPISSPAPVQHNLSTLAKPYPPPSQPVKDDNHGARPFQQFQPAQAGRNIQAPYITHSSPPSQTKPVQIGVQQPKTDGFQQRASMILYPPHSNTTISNSSIVNKEIPVNDNSLQERLVLDEKQAPTPSVPPLVSSQSGKAQQADSNNDLNKAPTLPSAVTGISPTKHSPPRPATASGVANIGFITPSVLPPVASLAPIPQKPNLTPPVKMAEPEKPRMMTPTTAP